MGWVRKLLQLPAREQFYLAEVICLVGLTRLGLWVLPFRTEVWLLSKTSQIAVNRKRSHTIAVTRIAWAVRASSRIIPQATCLTQALAAQFLLTRQGHPADLRIGVAKNSAGQLEAHAWVESDGQIVIGGVESPRRFTAFPSLSNRHKESNH